MSGCDKKHLFLENKKAPKKSYRKDNNYECKSNSKQF